MGQGYLLEVTYWLVEISEKQTILRKTANRLRIVLYQTPEWGSSCTTGVEHTPHNRELMGSIHARCYAFLSFYPK